MLNAVLLPDRGDAWPFDLPRPEDGRTVPLDAAVTILVGENGSGKSTLLEALAVAAELPAAGHRDRPADDPTLAGVRPLADALRLVWTARSRRGLFLRAEDFFGYVRAQNARDAEARAEAERVARERPDVSDLELRRMQGPWIGPVAARAARYGGDLDGRSHGEAFLDFFQARLRGPGLHLLDEPEAALSPLRQLALLAILRDAAAAGGQFVIATHAPIVMACPGARILEFADGRMRETAFDDLEPVRVLRAFLDAPEAYLRHL